MKHVKITQMNLSGQSVFFRLSCAFPYIYSLCWSVPQCIMWSEAVLLSQSVTLFPPPILSLLIFPLEFALKSRFIVFDLWYVSSIPNNGSLADAEGLASEHCQLFKSTQMSGCSSLQTLISHLERRNILSVFSGKGLKIWHCAIQSLYWL